MQIATATGRTSDKESQMSQAASQHERQRTGKKMEFLPVQMEKHYYNEANTVLNTFPQELEVLRPVEALFGSIMSLQHRIGTA